MIKKKYLLVFLVLSFFILSSLAVYSLVYGGGLYGGGSYGVGETESSSSPSSSSGGGGGGGGGGGSGSGRTVQVTDVDTLSVETPNDLLDDPAQSSFEMDCLSDSCSVTVTEVRDLPSDVANVYVSQGGDFVAAVRLQCEGEVGTSTATISVDPIEGVTCDGLMAANIEEDGSADEARIVCNQLETGALDVTAEFSGCSYLVMWHLVSHLEEETVGTEEEVVSQDQVVNEAFEETPERSLAVWFIILIIVIVLVIVYFALRSKKNHRRIHSK